MGQDRQKASRDEIPLPEDKLWGDQSEKSLENFKIGADKMPIELIQALALIKECCAKVNAEAGLLDKNKAQWIEKAAKEIQEGRLNDQFPLSVWQTGSGTQSHMNVNEVIASRAIQLSGGKTGSIHPNDDVNKSQSSNDTFPSAMRISLYIFVKKHLLPALESFEKCLEKKTKEFEKLIKTGRTHLMDAVPISLGQEFSAFYDQIVSDKKRIEKSLLELLFLPIGGTAVGTGLNTFPGFDKKVCTLIKKKTGYDFKPSVNKFAKISSHDDFVELSGSFKTLAVSLMKIANDIRLLGSGPRCGLGELLLPAGEPGSSIMPGKINPTQCEALAMLSAQVIGQDLSVTLGGSGGHLQLNTFKPLIIFNSLRSAHLLSDGLNNFRKKCLEGLKANEKKLKENLENSLMLVTALNPHIGYDKAARIAKAAHEKGSSLKEAAIQSGFVTKEQFEKWIRPETMIKPNKTKSEN